jgi:cytochrome c biogenesis protein CcmG/thiol:disulfide interchange protein DsbE
VSAGRTALRWTIPLAAVPLLVLLAYGFRTDPRAIPTPLVGKPAAKFTLQTFAGDEVSLERLRGRVVVLNFWASWCIPACYEEAPVLERAWQEWKDRGVTLVGINIQDREDAARAFIARFNHTFPNAADAGGRVSVDYGVYGVPETFFIDRAGRVRGKHVGAVTDAVVERQLRPLVDERT